MIILASQSPNRKFLLEQAGIQFEVKPSNIDEEAIAESNPAQLAKILALQKAQVIAKQHPDDTVIGADTIVAVGKTVLEKPKDEEDAKRTLAFLSGKTHQVHTGYAIIKKNTIINDVDTIEVTFRELTQQDIDDYVATKESFGHAGAYAAQKKAGPRFVTQIKGDPNALAGLPVASILKHLQ